MTLICSYCRQPTPPGKRSACCGDAVLELDDTPALHRHDLAILCTGDGRPTTIRCRECPARWDVGEPVEVNEALPPTSLPAYAGEPGTFGLPHRFHPDDTEAWRIMRADGRGGAAWLMDDDRRPTGRPVARIFLELDAQVIGAGPDAPVERRLYGLSPEQVLWLTVHFSEWLDEAEAALVALRVAES